MPSVISFAVPLSLKREGEERQTDRGERREGRRNCHTPLPPYSAGIRSRVRFRVEFLPKTLFYSERCRRNYNLTRQFGVLALALEELDHAEIENILR